MKKWAKRLGYYLFLAFVSSLSVLGFLIAFIMVMALTVTFLDAFGPLGALIPLILATAALILHPKIKALYEEYFGGI